MTRVEQIVVGAILAATLLIAHSLAYDDAVMDEMMASEHQSQP